MNFSPAIILSMTAVFFTIEECDHLQAVVSPQTRGLPDELVIGRLRTEPTQSGSSPFFATVSDTCRNRSGTMLFAVYSTRSNCPAAVLYRILPTFILRCCNCNGCAVTVIDLWFNQPVCKPGSVRDFPGQSFICDKCRHLPVAIHPEPVRTIPWVPARSRSKRGLHCHRPFPAVRCALTAPFHPYPNQSGGMFSVALSETHISQVLPGVLSCGARTFLRSQTAAIARPTGCNAIITRDQSRHLTGIRQHPTDRAINGCGIHRQHCSGAIMAVRFRFSHCEIILLHPDEQ